MCEFCKCEEENPCSHSAPEGDCGCDSIGTRTCPKCGHTCEPWYFGLSIPGREALAQRISRSDAFLRYPTRKEDLAGGLLSDEAFVAAGPEELVYEEDIQWLVNALPASTFRDPGDVLLALNPAIAWTKDSGDTSPLAFRWQSRAIGCGTALIVKQEEAAVLVRGSNLYDTFPQGKHVLTTDSAPLLSAASRRTPAHVAKKILNGTVVFVSLEKRIEQPFLGQGQTADSKDCLIIGKIDYTILDPKSFVGELLKTQDAIELEERDSSQLKGLANGELVSTLCFQVLSEEIAKQNDLESLESDHGISLLKQRLNDELMIRGIHADNLTFDHVGEPDEEAYAKLVQHEMKKSIAANKKQMSAQDIVMSTISSYAKQQGYTESELKAEVFGRHPQPGGLEDLIFNNKGQRTEDQEGLKAPEAIGCSKCSAMNPLGSKFCQNCGEKLPRKCISCGKIMGPKLKFCTSCGTSLP